jgi:hypothetical protein
MKNAAKQARMKRCTRCGKLKDKSEFGKQAKLKDGLRYWCKQCVRDYNHEYRRKHGKGGKKYRSFEEAHREVRGVRQKQCSGCRRWKPEDEFYKNHKTKDGLGCLCKKCTAEAARKYRERRLAVKN